MVEDGAGVAEAGVAHGAQVGALDGDPDGVGVGDGAHQVSSWRRQDFTADAWSGVGFPGRGARVGSGSIGAGGKGQTKICLT